LDYWQTHELNQKNRIQFHKNPEIDKVNITIDSAAVEIILNNLIENALLYSEDKEVEIVADTDQKGVYILIKDRGLGFTAEEKDNFQKMFYRSERHTIQNIRGSGLGHFIINSIIKKFNMQLTLLSKGENLGSEFKLYLR
jgi:two-component system sensor histidine kinase ResE